MHPVPSADSTCSLALLVLTSMLFEILSIGSVILDLLILPNMSSNLFMPSFENSSFLKIQKP